jgi:hypothetical protein
LIICLEVLLMEKRNDALAIKVAQAARASGQDDTVRRPTVFRATEKRLSV